MVSMDTMVAQLWDWQKWYFEQKTVGGSAGEYTRVPQTLNLSIAPL